jgi:hypothetical protein
VSGKRKLLTGLRLVGITLLIPAALWLFGGMLGVLPTEMAEIAGYSGLRVIGSAAVGGCLLAAIGSADI